MKYLLYRYLCAVAANDDCFGVRLALLGWSIAMTLSHRIAGLEESAITGNYGGLVPGVNSCRNAAANRAM